MVNSLPFWRLLAFKDYLLILTLTFLIVWRWSLFSLRWPVLQGSRFFLVYVRGLCLVLPYWMTPPPSVLVSFFTNTFQVDGPVPFCCRPNLAFKHQLPWSSRQRDSFFSSVGLGKYLSEDERWLVSSSPYRITVDWNSSTRWVPGWYSNVKERVFGTRTSDDGCLLTLLILPNTSGAVTNSLCPVG